ncbi:acyltransferase [Halobacillus shinanisalinarum]|uniref:Acyltransferase n=1 Tax=Halobacillus shinanisalinarum TaxID=2932258 RepID=A0ABY4GZM5_9BACI|nr:acyltransferase [Halobacillus shinanisalinarum]UOQ92212.1 acyltransferase [Halobacillus shinanisalinarum]
MARERIESVYYLRVFAMLMVVMVHVTAAFQAVLTDGSDAYQTYHFINRIIRVEAGIFIMIIGMVFFYKYMSQKMDLTELKKYYKKRALYILIPYLVWAFFYEALSVYIGVVPLNFVEMTWRILQGESFYHLYFIFIIVQFYLIFPVILYLAQKLTFFKRYMWLFGIGIEIGYYFLDREYQIIPFSIFISSLGPYLLGAWIGAYYKEQKALINRKSTIIWGLFVSITGFYYVYLNYHMYTISSFVLPGYIYLIVNLFYILSASYLLFRLTEYICSKWPNAIPYVQNAAYYSFGFYLLHPFVLKVVAQFVPVPAGYWFHGSMILRFIGTVVLCYLIIWLFHRFFPFPNIMFGKLPKKARFILSTNPPSIKYRKTGSD